MLDEKGFNLWADDYDKTVRLSDEKNEYPFAGYKKILNIIFNEVMTKSNSSVLDIGFGTGILTKMLYDNGHHIDGIDFSSEMIRTAQEKMPEADLIEWDITRALPGEFLENEYDFIILTYSIHHLNDSDKIKLIIHLLNHLSDNAKILIGDVAFKNMESLQTCRQKYQDYWDSDEFYIIYSDFETLLSEYGRTEFKQVSHCGGVLEIKKI